MQVIRYSTVSGDRYEIVDAPIMLGTYERVTAPVMLGGYVSTNMPPWVRQYLRAVDVYLAQVFLGAPEGMTISEYFARLMSRVTGRPVGESMQRFHWFLAEQVGRWMHTVAPAIPAHVAASELYDVFEDIR